MSEIKSKRNGSSVAEDQRMEKVKEILFGHELRIVEDRMAANQAQFEAQLARLKKSAEEKIRLLEAQLKKQHDDFAKDLAKSEAKTDAANTANINRTNAEDSKLAARLDKLRATQKDDLRELKAQLAEQTKALGNSIKTNTKQLDNRITTEIESLRKSHVDRAMLAELFESFAASLDAE